MSYNSAIVTMATFKHRTYCQSNFICLAIKLEMIKQENSYFKKQQGNQI